MLKITSSAGKLRQAAEKVINDYAQLEKEYAALLLRDRRDLSKGLTFEVFCAAAILEGGMAAHCRKIDNSGTMIQPQLSQISEHFVDEFSPAAYAWFADLASFWARAHDETRSLTSTILAEENVHLARIQWKYRQVCKLLTSLQQPKNTKCNLELPFWTMDIYNLACEKISQGMIVPKAMDFAQTEMRYRRGQLGEDEFMASAGVRTWFPVDLAMPVWKSADQVPDFAKMATTTSNTTLMPPPLRRLGQRSASTDPVADSTTTAATSSNGNSSLMPPPIRRLGAGTTPNLLLKEYEQRWNATLSHASEIPYPNHDLNADGFRNRARLPYPKQKVDKWSPDSIINVMVKRFFIDAVGLRGNLIAYNDEPSKATLELSRNSSYLPLRELRRIMKFETTRWLPYQLNKRTGVQGQTDMNIAQRPGNVAVRTAVQELLEDCVGIIGQD